MIPRLSEAGDVIFKVRLLARGYLSIRKREGGRERGRKGLFFFFYELSLKGGWEEEEEGKRSELVVAIFGAFWYLCIKGKRFEKHRKKMCTPFARVRLWHKEKGKVENEEASHPYRENSEDENMPCRCTHIFAERKT